jgi:hypothetical protein
MHFDIISSSFQLDHLTAVQGFGRMQYLMGHLRCKNNTGQLLKILIDFTHLECGCPMAIFESSHHAQYKLTILTSNWVTDIWTYPTLYNAQLEISGLWKPRPQGIADNTLMELATSSGLFTAPEMRDPNR